MQCKLGDLCYIKKSMRPANIGLIVTCQSYLGYFLEGDTIEMNGESWLAPFSDNYWLITNSSGSIETQFGKSKEAYIPDLWLVPITGLPLEEEEDLYNTIDDEVHV